MDSFLTSVELSEQHSISKTLMYAWFDALENAGLARRAPGRPWGTKLFSNAAVGFLETRKGKFGPMGKSRQDVLQAWIDERST